MITHVTDDATGLPAVNAEVIFPYTYGTISGQPIYAMTDAEGVAHFDNDIPLGPRQSLQTLQLQAYPPDGATAGSTGSSGSVVVPECGSTIPINLTIHQPVRYAADLGGHVVDDVTNTPVPNASVTVSGAIPTPYGPWYVSLGNTTTGTTGDYSIPDVFIGFDITTAQRFVQISKDGYWNDGKVAVTITANQTNTYDTRGARDTQRVDRRHRPRRRDRPWDTRRNRVL